MKTHFIVEGNSLGLGDTVTACGEIWKQGVPMPDGKARSGYFGEESTLKRITCRKCMASKIFRVAWEQQFPDEPHPFQVAAKKAVVTTKIRKDIRKARAEASIEFILSLPEAERHRAVNDLIERSDELDGIKSTNRRK